MSYPTKASFTFNHVDQATDPDTTPAAQKLNFDKRSEEMRVALNAVTALLNAVTDGASGADNLGMTAITETGTAANVQSIIEALITRLKAITDSASGADLIGVTAISGLTGGNVQTLLEALNSALATHKTSSDHDGRYYTESESDAKFALSNSVWTKISEQTIAVDAAAVEFASIPAGYKDFKLTYEARHSNSTNLAPLSMQFNDDAGANYRSGLVVGTGTTISGFALTYISLFGALTPTAASTILSYGTVEISNSNPLIAKRVLAECYGEQSASSMSRSTMGGTWTNSTDAITKISLVGLIGAGSRFVLWGCK